MTLYCIMKEGLQRLGRPFKNIYQKRRNTYVINESAGEKGLF